MPIEPTGWVSVHAREVNGPTFLEMVPEAVVEQPIEVAKAVQASEKTSLAEEAAARKMAEAEAAKKKALSCTCVRACAYACTCAQAEAEAEAVRKKAEAEAAARQKAC